MEESAQLFCHIQEQHSVNTIGRKTWYVCSEFMYLRTGPQMKLVLNS
jgi:hypothetical protein